MPDNGRGRVGRKVEDEELRTVDVRQVGDGRPLAEPPEVQGAWRLGGDAFTCPWCGLLQRIDPRMHYHTCANCGGVFGTG